MTNSLNYSSAIFTDAVHGNYKRLALHAMQEYADQQLAEYKAKVLAKIEAHQKHSDTDTSGFYALENLKEDL